MGIIVAQFVIQLALLLVSIDSTYSLSQDGQAGQAQCYHSPEKPTVGVHIPSTQSDDAGRKKRISDSSEFQQLRMFIHYDDSVNTQLDSVQRNRLQDIVIPAAEDFFESALSVRPLSDPILLDRDCNDGLFVIPVGEVRECFNQCAPQTTCGPIEVPEDHLKRCVECDGNFSTCATPPGSMDGNGIPNADLVIYVGTSLADGICSPTSSVIAFASACQLENTLDRPISGYINFCPATFASLTDAENIEVALHELTHVLAFSSSLYPFFRDENGEPRTPRDAFGFPPFDPNIGFVASANTTATITYDDWLTRNGEVSRQVDMLVTPNVIEQAKIHFGCDDIIGVELENQGGSGTAFSHWEHRVVGNEAMTGVLLFNGPFSRITFGLFEDSGWYSPNYEVAQELAWGRNRGCSIPHGSCAEYIQNQQASQRTLSPFCNALQGVQPPVRTCSVDRDLFAECSLIEFGDGAIPSEFQYFNSGLNFGSDVAPRVGGSFIFMDYCPFESPFSIDISASSCSNPLDVPGDNIAGETYGAGSRCIEHGQTWTRMTGVETGTYDVGIGCYQYSCSPLGVEIHLLGFRYLCSCEGEELLIDNTIDGVRYQGSFICPSCLSLCFDDLDNCANPEPDACPGQQTVAAPLPSNRVQCYQEYDSGSCSTLLGPSASPSDCCDTDGGNAYQTPSGECIQCSNNTTTDDMIEIAIERNVYSVIEGNELEVCVIVLAGSSFPEFEVTANLDYNSNNIEISITVQPGNFRSCGTLSIPDNLCLDKNDEYQIAFSVLTPIENATIIFERDTAWLFIIDDDIVQIGLQQDIYEVSENGSLVSVCMQLLEGFPCHRPVDARLYTMDGNATAEEDYNPTTIILSIPVGSAVGALACTSISIINDEETEDLEYFSVHIDMEDLNIRVPSSSTESAIINIKDDDIPEFEIQFNGNTPMVNGDSVLLSFSSTLPVDEATCSVSGLGSTDCKSGSALFSPFRRRRRRPYTGTITARAGDETLTLQRTFRSELTGYCDVHLINDGLTIDGQTATIQVQGTGPSAANRITEFQCLFDSGDVFSCGSNPIQVIIPTGSLQLTIIPQDNENSCTQLRTLVVNLQQDMN